MDKKEDKTSEPKLSAFWKKFKEMSRHLLVGEPAVQKSSESEEGEKKVTALARDRSNIQPLVAEMQSGLFVPKISDEQLDRVIQAYVSNSEGEQKTAAKQEAYKIWDELKEERNAFFALFLPEIWQTVRVSLPEMRERLSRITRGKRADAVFLNILNALEDAFFQAIDQWQKKYESSTDQSPYKTAYERYKKLLEFAKLTKVSKNADVQIFLKQGSGTFVQSTFGLGRVIAELLSEQNALTPEHFLKTFRISFGPVIVRLASLNLTIAADVLKAVFKYDDQTGLLPIQERFFSLERVTKKTTFRTRVKELLTGIAASDFKLSLNHSELMKITNSLGKLVFDSSLSSQTTGCPAAVAKGEKQSVLKESFDVSESLLTEFYLPVYIEEKGTT